MNKCFKVLLFSVLLFMLSSFVYATDFKNWRSTEITAANTDVNIATGVVRIWDVTVASGSNSAATFTYFNSSAAIADGVIRSTSSAYDTDTSASNYPINDVVNRGFRYTTVGTAIIRVRWDWEYTIPAGQEGIGLK